MSVFLDKYLNALDGFSELFFFLFSQFSEKVPGAIPSHQHFYIGEDLLNISMPSEQMRKKARAEGLLEGEEEKEGEPKLAPCFLYVNPKPLDFSDMLNEDLIKKLRGKAQGEKKQIIFRIKLNGAENKLCIPVDSSSVTVDQFKQTLLKKLGPTSITGLTAEKLLLYEREKQPGRPLEGTDLQPLFGTKIKIDVDGFPVNDPVSLRILIKKYMGFITVEEHSVSMYDHLLVCDLIEKICEDMKNSENKTVAEAEVTPENIQLKINGHSLSKKGMKDLVKKFGIPPNQLWLRAFNVKDKSPVIVYL
ncbi:hypothetical protein, conserved [Eimeria brunetti]|uniref:Uncharacterized protein n=1 Tax=Eimeria brunetti TaxID=51314 RepID=U6LKA9_9EIME|nr:hypothetical protein, conserved [Eimeria brunetti]